MVGFSENSSFFVMVGMTALFLLVGTLTGLHKNGQFGHGRKSFVTKFRNKPYSSDCELRLLIQSLEFEKGLTAEGVVRATEAMNKGKIDTHEYDRLILQYNEKLQSYEKKIADLRSTLDYVEIQELRKDLDYFLHDRMKLLDDKLQQLARRKGEGLKLDSGSSQGITSETDTRAWHQANKPPRFFRRRTQSVSDQESRIQETQKEIYAALERLETAESDNSRNSSEKDRSRDFCQHIIEHFLDREGQVIGLGSGRTIAEFLSRVKDLPIMDSLRFVTSSLQIRLQAEHHDLNVADENEVTNIQVLLDGADQIDSGYHMIKGGGGALFREKILFKAARKLVILADGEKYVNNLHRAVPVEVHPFARRLFIKEINNLGIKVRDCALRSLQKGFPFFTENGNVIFDVQFESIGDISEMETDIKCIPGVIEVGLFPRPDNTFEITEFGIH